MTAAVLARLPRGVDHGGVTEIDVIGDPWRLGRVHSHALADHEPPHTAC